MSSYETNLDHRRLRRAGVCTVCLAGLDRGTSVMWDRSAQTPTCLPCFAGPTVDGAGAGTAGGSAAQQADRRRAAEDEAARRHRELPWWRRVLERPPPTADRSAAWRKGAAGERRLGDRLDTLAARGIVTVLHDRRLAARSSANIDHIVVAAGGVWVVDAKNYRGRIEVTGRRSRLIVGGRDRTALVPGVRRQVRRVMAELRTTYPAVPVYGALCFVGAERRRGRRAQTVGNVLVTWEKDLDRRLRDPGRLDEPHRAAIQHHLARRFGPAARVTP